MKFLKYLLYLLIIGAIIFATVNFFNRPKDAQTNATQETPATEVSVTKASEFNQTFLDTIGTVKSKGQVEIYPSTSATIEKINVTPGQQVKKGDLIFVLAGFNGAEHPSVTQRKIAETNLAMAKKTYSNALSANRVGQKSAELQLQNAVHQAQALAYDVRQFDQNMQGINNSLNILNSTSNISENKNERDLSKTARGIDQLISGINETQNQRRTLLKGIDDTTNQINEINQQLAGFQPDQNGTYPAEYSLLQQQLTALTTAQTASQEALSEVMKALETQYTAIDQARYGYSSALSGIKIGENTLDSQIQQLQNQLAVLDLTKNSTVTKLGYDGNSSDPLKLAEQGFQSAQIQLDNALTQAKTQFLLAQMSYELAKNSADGLQVKALIDGVIGDISLNVGDLVSPQTMLTEIINPISYQLEVGLDISSADKVTPGSKAEIQFGEKYLQAPVKSVSPSANAKNKLVSVIIDLPPVFFRNNQTLNVRIPLTLSQNAKTLFLPLDAVTIGSEETFIYLNKDGVAKKTIIKLGEIFQDKVEVLEGISATDEVIVSGSKNLIDNAKVKTI
jgi:RND family efflux transporter MFP subunit